MGKGMGPPLVIPLLFWLTALTGAGTVPADDEGRARIEARREAETERLIGKGYSTTLGYSYFPKAKDEFILRPFLAPGAEGDKTHFRIWNRCGAGRVHIAVRDAGGRVVWKAEGRDFARKKALKLKPGRYTLELDLSGASDGALLVAVKGTLVWVCGHRPGVEEVRPGPGDAFAWRYLLYVPPGTARRRLLVAPNNTGFTSDDGEVHLERARCAMRQAAAMGDRLGCAVLVPVFPRPASLWNSYTHALDRDTLMESTPALNRLDLQLIAMIDDARGRLGERGLEIGPRVWLAGFSASGMFANRFTLLHPDRVAAAACGSPGGWPIAPAEEAGGESLPYPIGVADVEALTGTPADLETFKAVPQFLFMGDQDTNDSVVFRDGYEAADEALIFRLFGRTPVQRWPAARRLYGEAGCNARFVLYPGVGHQVTEAMTDAIVEFFLSEGEWAGDGGGKRPMGGHANGAR